MNMISLTNKEEKLIVSLQRKKFRKQEKLFFVEGGKMVEEALASGWNIKWLVATTEEHHFSNEDYFRHCSEKSMSRMSTLSTPPGILAVVKFPEDEDEVASDVSLLIDRVQDPGNLGTIIRTADAFGIKNIICSKDTVDFFSPKVVQATMGSIFRVQPLEHDLKEFLAVKNSPVVYGAHLQGENLYETEMKTPCYLLVGNESQGIQDELLSFVSNKVKIPMQGKAESFNVSIATAIILSEFRRRLG